VRERVGTVGIRDGYERVAGGAAGGGGLKGERELASTPIRQSPTQVREAVDMSVEGGGAHAELRGEPRERKGVEAFHVDELGGRAYHSRRVKADSRHQRVAACERAIASSIADTG